MCVKRTHLWPFFLSPSCTVSWRTRASARLYASAAFSSFCATVPPPPLPLLTFPLLPCRAFAPAPAPEALELPRTTEDLRRSSCSAFSSASCGIWWRWRITIIRFSFGSRVSRIACGSSYIRTLLRWGGAIDRFGSPLSKLEGVPYVSMNRTLKPFRGDSTREGQVRSKYEHGETRRSYRYRSRELPASEQNNPRAYLSYTASKGGEEN